ncbi:hybrid sensor histidine kinase/response regulator [Dolichospermum sp. ST_sed1]|nr:hybrid sensor histidine kinase/response regulator [Dolichospermum sp. ST_sed1]MDD1437889.1 hybrid sensor histidine kinase/response regulator [Dolichospermum sp. ST_sed10]MDD1441747.1 hybrid sensor histidine kinase/response regulator [Dolichospermum sp. ST_sed3]MDD1449254.1 hybrid sensor histidine kinase/response regulator [Dolichospermum sp. ST_sed8]MDD1467286.1 hybrid sensor histidine kinase/response regulator [Dolichospermum sp. ST_sed5]MDD1474818.1 hybrid sensor histidine kinase/response
MQNQATILVIEDNLTNLKIIAHILIAAGYNVLTEVEGLNVIEKVNSTIPDLILLDIILPEISGFEICQQLQADPFTQSIPIIFMTALIENGDKIKGLSLGAVDYITKPFQKEELLARVRTHLHLRQLSKTLEIQNQELIKTTKELENKSAELKESLVKEKELNLLKSRFITMVSHEFRTPLTIISSSSAILEKFSNRLTEDKKNKHLQTIQNSIQHITEILDDVLMISWSEPENIELRLESLDIIVFCGDLKEQIEISNPQYRIDFLWYSDEEIIDNSFMVQLDKKRLQQVLMNILSNAIKYSPDHNVVKFILYKENNQLIFEISDSGIGIPEADQANLFDSFHRGSNISNISGTGLGLSIVKKYLDLLQGEIKFKSRVGKGTTFTVSIPCKQLQD